MPAAADESPAAGIAFSDVLQEQHTALRRNPASAPSPDEPEAGKDGPVRPRVAHAAIAGGLSHVIHTPAPADGEPGKSRAATARSGGLEMPEPVAASKGQRARPVDGAEWLKRAPRSDVSAEGETKGHDGEPVPVQVLLVIKDDIPLVANLDFTNVPPSPARQIIAHLRQPVREIVSAPPEAITGQPVRQFRLSLQPEQLGDVHISLRMAAGRLTVDIRADRAESASLLGRETGALGAALSSPGVVDPGCAILISVAVTGPGAVDAIRETVLRGGEGGGASDWGSSRGQGESPGHSGAQHDGSSGGSDDQTAKRQTARPSGTDTLLVV